MPLRLAKRPAPRQYPRQKTGQSIPILAPSMGMNTRDGVASLQQLEARSIRNMIAENGRLLVRKGKTSHQTIPDASSVGTLFTHEGVSQNIILCAANGKIFDATGEPDELATGYSLNLWSFAQFNDTTIGVNGTDMPVAFDGSAIGASGLSGSGLTIANLRTVHVVRTRLWFTEEGSADVWYLPVESITGVLTKLNLSEQTKGGYCVGIYPYRTYTVFVMSTGEVAVYQGDPGDDFSDAGAYDCPPPVGYDPGLNVQGDLIIMTTGGPLPFEAIASGVAFDTSALQTWGKVSPSWVDDFVEYGQLSQWNSSFFNGLVIFNVPTDAETSKQWVYNTRTKAWSFFESLDGFNFTESSGVLYFGDRGSGEIFTYSGGTDDGASIVGTVRHGFTYPFQSQVNGQFTLARLSVQATGIVTGQIQVDVDYRESGIVAPEFPLASSGAGPWGQPWGMAWGENGSALLRWSSVKGFGRAVAPVAQFNSQADDLQYFSVDVVVAPAGIIG